MDKPSSGGNQTISNSKDGYPSPCRSLDDLLLEVQEHFERQLKVDILLSISQKLQGQLKRSLISNPQCMLPSHHYHLPSGQEKGIYLALEVGGSNLKVALIELKGQDVTHGRLEMLRMECSPIEERFKDLSEAFFDWIAQKIEEMLSGDAHTHNHTKGVKPLRMGIAWSFPLELVHTWRLYALLYTN
jgi:hexokinase